MAKPLSASIRAAPQTPPITMHESGLAYTPVGATTEAPGSVPEAAMLTSPRPKLEGRTGSLKCNRTPSML